MIFIQLSIWCTLDCYLDFYHVSFFFQPSYLLMNHLKDKFLANYWDYSIDSGIILIYGTQFCNIYCESLEIDV